MLPEIPTRTFATALADRPSHRPSQFSGVGQQRIAMARAVVGEPQLILADEPTGNLDLANSQIFADFLVEEHRRGRTIVLVTHDESLLHLGNRTVQLTAGQIVRAGQGQRISGPRSRWKAREFEPLRV